MITTAKEYYANLFKIVESGNIPSLATLLPSSERIYTIDLDSRTIEAPEFLSVVTDHQSETVYFIVDRFFDNTDLSTTACVIQYINGANEGRLYSVPYYDIETYKHVNKMLIPWCIEGEATKAAGEVSYAIRFFKVSGDGKSLTYNLNTSVSKSKVLYGLNILDYFIVDLTEETYEPNKYYLKDEDGNYYKSQNAFNATKTYYSITEGYNYPAGELDRIYDRLAAIERDFNVYWYTTDEVK